MPIARFQMPDGRIARFEIPEGTNPEQAQSMMSDYIKQNPTFASQEQQKTPDRDEGFWNRHLGLFKDIVGEMNKPASQIRQDIVKRAKIYGGELADLGKRNVRFEGGKVVPDLATDVSRNKQREEDIKNAIISLSTPPVGRVSEALGKELGVIKPNVGAESVSRAIQAGYKSPPSKVADITKTPSMKMKFATLLEGISGSPQLTREAIVSNQINTNRLARQMLGLKEGEALTPELLQDLRAKQGGIYDLLKKSNFRVETNSEWRNSLKNLEGDVSNAVKDFPELHSRDITSEIRTALNKDSFSVPGLIEEVKNLRYRGTTNLKNWMDPEKRALGLAQKKAAGMLDDLLEKNLKDRGLGDVAKSYRNARTNIAQLHDLEASLNEASGDIDARYLASLTKGKTISGQMKTITDFARTFSRENRLPSMISGNVPIGKLEAYALASGKKGITAIPILSSALRKIIMSDRFQNWINNPQGKLPPHVQEYLDNIYKLAATQTGPNENTDRRD